MRAVGAAFLPISIYVISFHIGVVRLLQGTSQQPVLSGQHQLESLLWSFILLECLQDTCLKVQVLPHGLAMVSHPLFLFMTGACQGDCFWFRSPECCD